MPHIYIPEGYLRIISGSVDSVFTNEHFLWLLTHSNIVFILIWFIFVTKKKHNEDIRKIGNDNNKLNNQQTNNNYQIIFLLILKHCKL